MPTEREENNKCLPFNIQTHRKWDNPKVSVIVPVYKVDKYLTQCLNSIVNQTMEELEIIIVDEGDHDRCRDIIDYFEAHDPRIIAPHQKNGGYAVSCNLGISMAKGEYLAIVESDDWIEPEMYEEMYAYAKALDADVVKTPYYEAFSDGHRYDCHYRNYIKEKVPQNMCFSLKDFGEILQVHPSVWSAIYKTEYMNKANIRFVEKKGSYVDCGFRISLINTKKLAWLDKPYYNYRVDSEGSSVNSYKIDQMIDRWEEFLAVFNERNEEFDNYYAPHLIIEVWRNLIESIQYRNLHPSNQEYMRIGKILQRFSESTILNSNAINDEIKRDLISFRRNPSIIKRRIKNNKTIESATNKIEIVLEKLANPILLFFAFSGFVTFGGTKYYFMRFNMNLPFALSVVLNIITFGCLTIISISLIAKLLHRCLKLARRIYKEKIK